MAFRFEKLDVWGKAMEWTKDVYLATDFFPDHERFGLTSQLRRAAVSVPSNLAEGTGYSSDAAFLRFIEIAYRSLMEAVCQIQLSENLGYLTDEKGAMLRLGAEELARMLSGLRSSRRRLK